MLANLEQGELELLGESRGLHGRVVGLGPLGLRLALGLFGAAGPRGRRGHPLGGVGRHRLDLGLSGIRIGERAQLVDERVQLRDEVLPHPRDLPADLTRALTRRINGPILLHDGPARLLGQPAPRTPRGGPSVPRIVAVLRRAPRDALSRNNHANAPREPAGALIRLTENITHNVTLA